MPITVSSPPVDLPDISTLHILGHGNSTLDPLGLVSEIGSPFKDFYLIPFDALPFPDHVPEVKRRSAMGPEDPLDLLCECCNFILSKCHGSFIPDFPHVVIEIQLQRLKKDPPA